MAVVGEEQTVLVDCGSSPIVRMQKAVLDLDRISDIVLTHFHPDHVSGPPLLLMDMWLMGLTCPPNYFGEIVLWIGIAIIALPVLQGWAWVALISPVFVTLLLTRVSGVPLLEKRAEQKWGGQEDYEAYKRTTPVLIPRF